MNDPLDQIAKLAARAVKEEPPAIHAAPGVIAALRRKTAVQNRPLFWLTAGSVAAAILVAFLSSDLISAIEDPVLAILISAVTISL